MQQLVHTLVVQGACGHVDVGTCPHQVLAVTLTQSQPGGADYAHSILVSTQSFESHRRTCSVSAPATVPLFNISLWLQLYAGMLRSKLSVH